MDWHGTHVALSFPAEPLATYKFWGGTAMINSVPTGEPNGIQGIVAHPLEMGSEIKSLGLLQFTLPVLYLIGMEALLPDPAMPVTCLMLLHHSVYPLGTISRNQLCPLGLLGHGVKRRKQLTYFDFYFSDKHQDRTQVGERVCFPQKIIVHHQGTSEQELKARIWRQETEPMEGCFFLTCSPWLTQ